MVCEMNLVSSSVALIGVQVRCRVQAKPRIFSADRKSRVFEIGDFVNRCLRLHQQRFRIHESYRSRAGCASGELYFV